jgi:hypothetical protein
LGFEPSSQKILASITFASFKKTQDIGGNSFDLELRSNFEYALGHKAPKNCSHKYNISTITFFGNV